MAIKILKLTSTEEIIGDYEERDGKCFIGKPARVVIAQDETGIVLVVMPLPWIPFTDDKEIEIKAECIMTAPMEPTESVRNDYNEIHGSGIVTLEKGSIIA